MEIEVRCVLPRYKEEDSPSMLDDAAVAEWPGTSINPTLCFWGEWVDQRRLYLATMNMIPYRLEYFP